MPTNMTKRTENISDRSKVVDEITDRECIVITDGITSL